VGVPIVSFYTAADDLKSIARAMKHAGEDADVVLITGGLGPTDDDLTRQGMAKFLGVELELKSELLDRIEHFFIRRGRQMVKKNRIQAYLPVGAKSLANNIGTAPGIMAEAGGSFFFAMPGVPSEMKAMFGESVLAVVEKLGTAQSMVIRKLKCFGAGESDIAERLGNFMQRDRNPQINCTVEYGAITLHIIATAKDSRTAEQMAEKDEDELAELLGNLVYGRGEESLAEVVGRKLTEQNKTISVAESCTGGLIGKLLTDVPGASGYFKYGWVTYSNEAKISELGVKADLIETEGAVSKAVCEALAKGARKKAASDISVGVTGIAGPSGGSEQKPVGLVYISVSSDQSSETRRFVFSHARRFIRQRAAQSALNMVRLKL